MMRFKKNGLSPQTYSYKVKIINPNRKSEVVLRNLYGFSSKFESVIGLRAMMMEKFGDQVPSSVSFDVGYFEGQQHSKLCLCSNDDLKSMYMKYPKGEITLWCEGKGTEHSSVREKRNGKRKRDEPSTSNRQDKEEEVESVFKELKSKHGDKFDAPRLRLWVRMIASNLHEDMDTSPQVPAFNLTPKRQKQSESFASALSGAAVAFAKALGNSPRPEHNENCTPHVTASVSPRKTVELRMKNYEQLRYLQTLFDDGILSEMEFMEQKRNILKNL